MAYDVLIKGGRIYDGSGLPSYLGEVAIADGRIVETGRINANAKRVVQADGLAALPGKRSRRDSWKFRTGRSNAAAGAAGRRGLGLDYVSRISRPSARPARSQCRQSHGS